MIKKIIFNISIILLLLVVLVTTVFIANPLMKSEVKIKEKLLESTPIGTNMDDVITYIESQKKWKVAWISEEHGFYHQGVNPRKTIGGKSIRVELGDYRIVFITSVTVYWGFDEDSELIDIWVWKTTDVI